VHGPASRQGDARGTGRVVGDDSPAFVAYARLSTVPRAAVRGGRPPPGCAGGSGGPAHQHARLRQHQRQVVVQPTPRVIQQPGNQPVQGAAQR
jgi:hypothetical protein